MHGRRRGAELFDQVAHRVVTRRPGFGVVVDAGPAPEVVRHRRQRRPVLVAQGLVALTRRPTGRLVRLQQPARQQALDHVRTDLALDRRTRPPLRFADARERDDFGVAELHFLHP
jgi:hypothetical protein